MTEVQASFLENLLGTEGYKKFLNPVKSDYQKRFEKDGWTFFTNERATNYLMGVDYWGEPMKVSLRRLREDLRYRLPNRKVRFGRAYDADGKRIPKEKGMVAIYLKDRE